MKLIQEAKHDPETYRITEPALWQCDCGAHIHCEFFTSTCDRCGADYNQSGQRLAPRSQWGEETGESLSDIFMADVDPWGGDY